MPIMNSLVEELLEEWEDSHDRGQPKSAEELCAARPELIGELKKQISALQAFHSCYGIVGDNAESLNRSDSLSPNVNRWLQIESEFQIQRLHARGGLGEVYIAHDSIADRTVAIKFPRPDRSRHEHLARFHREAQVTGRLNHPGIVPVYSLRPAQASEPCYVMRFIDGPTLQDRSTQVRQQAIVKSGLYSTFEFRQLLQNMVTLCNIVAYAHDQGVIHRDIKPANVILGPFGETMLMDWGLAKFLDEAEPIDLAPPPSQSQETVSSSSLSTRAGQMLGTPAFASPEQLQGRIDLVDERTDVYALGATLFFVLTQSPPGNETSHEGLRDIGKVPTGLAAICEKAMARAIDARYQSATELREDLERYLAGEPISVVRETLRSRLARWIRRRSTAVAAILMGVIITSIAAAAGSYLLGKKNLELRSANDQLTIAIADATTSQQRATSTSELLSRALRSATPEVAQGKEPTVRQLLNETSRRLRDDKTINDFVAANTHQIISDAYLSLADYDLALQHAQQASQLHSKLSGENSDETLLSKASVALLLSRKDNDNEAIQMAEAVSIVGRANPHLHPETLATLLDIYAHVLSAAPQPDHEKVVELHRQAYSIAKEHLPPDHLLTLKLATNYAVALMDAGKLTEAEPLLVDVYQAHKKLLGDKHPDTLVDVMNLVALKFKQEKFSEALEICDSNVPILEEVLGEGHQRSIRLQLLRTKLCFSLGRLEDAHHEAEACLERSLQSLGPAHQDTIDARGMLATALLALGKLEQAETVAQQQYQIAKDEFGPKHANTIQAITLLFDLADAKGDLKELERWSEQLRGSEWEAAAQAAVKAAQEKAQQSAIQKETEPQPSDPNVNPER